MSGETTLSSVYPKLQQKKWMERTPHHFTLLFISCRICPVQLNYKYNHSVRAKVIPLSIPFGPWTTLQAGYEFHIKVACTPIHTHLHPNTHTQFITLQHSTKEGHVLFNNMLTSIKEGSHKKNESFLFLILLTSQLLRWGWRVVDICCYGCCCGKVVIIRRVFWVFFCILIPSCIERTDVGKLINKSLGNVEVRLRVQRLREGREMFCWIIDCQHINTQTCTCN